MSVHKECGEWITWARRTDDPDRFMPPLEYVGEVYLIDEAGTAIQVHGYQPHHCDSAKVEAWQEYQQKLASLQSKKSPELDMTSWEVARERRREEQWDLALRVKCSVCGARKNEKCISLAPRYKGKEAPELKNPHTPRLEEAQVRYGTD